MKKRGIINAQLAGLIAGLGHKDTFMIGDGGMPIPKGVEIVDLALCGGVPTFRYGRQQWGILHNGGNSDAAMPREGRRF